MVSAIQNAARLLKKNRKGNRLLEARKTNECSGKVLTAGLAQNSSILSRNSQR
jgi:hypothetical protein